MPPQTTIIVPALNSAATLGASLASVRGFPGLHELIVVDGGSVDGTVAIAAAQGARVVHAPAGRGVQLAAGAAVATGDWLLFLHSDTCLTVDGIAEAEAFISNPANGDAAAAFRMTLDDERPAARWVEWIAATRTRILALPYGDQGLLISRRLYDTVGGFRPIAIMEDVDIARRLGRKRIHLFQSAVVTTAERYRKHGFWWRPIRNLSCLTLWFLGVSPETIARIYNR
ncbi:MAG: TIGR04283 family arsenosugar biosynthesis glycosyltransferase [Rhodospirillaceae bacterium]|nr:TIGR04283 family arsenosugar biosynthesis glycosyltransferase [Rhodospirillaceae bacterium]